MISSGEFILAYNELFRFLHKRYGKKGVVDFWIYISDKFLTNLDVLVKEKGISGMAEYWTHTLTEEGAEYQMSVGENYFEILIKKCPSVGKLNKAKVEKYPYYCEHCDILYRRVIEKYGFNYKIRVIDKEKGVCVLRVLKKEGK
ncbi:MAG: hypothetical protein PHI44_00090 [Candidatus Ratteibacteria bacterium]|nr:hypothetical protein [Candidatus Ratteibacteria bacterium]